MEEYYPEFFNDVFGPVMQPGSSSHTAGPCRLGCMANKLLSAPLKHILIEFDRHGSFAGTFGLMNEDLGMLSGAYGMTPDDARMFDIRRILADEGIDYRFRQTDFPAGSHPNAVRFKLTDIKGRVVTLVGNSMGGGRVETVRIMDVPYRFIGDSFLTCVSAENPDVMEAFKDARGVLSVENVTGPDKEELYLVRSERRLDALPCQVKKVIFRLEPVLPVPTVAGKKKQLFTAFDEWISLAEKKNLSLPEVAVMYEQNASGWPKEKIIKYMETLMSLLEKQTRAVYEDDGDILKTPYSGYHYAAWRDYESAGTPISGEVIAKAIHYAFGVQASVKGILMVPGPMGTGGGFLYSAMRAVKEVYGYSDKAVLDGLFVAAGVGAIAYTRTNPTGEVTGCAGECGICGAMAAAGITQMSKGTPRQVEDAASLTLQAAAGWPCDPIPGGYNQPCVSRFLTAVVMSIVFSDVALSGRSAVIPFHEAVDAVDRLGRHLPDSLKCTSTGGFCDTPSGCVCRENFEKWRNCSNPTEEAQAPLT